MDKPFFTIAIPTYEMDEVGVKFLAHSFNNIKKQTFTDFEVVISDHSKNDDIKNLCEEYTKIFEINYFKNKNNMGSSSANLNNAILNAKGQVIKILFQDDFFFDEFSLENTALNFDVKVDKWLVSRCEHTFDGSTFIRDFTPMYNEMIYTGNNTISSPSVLSILNNKPFLFDENLINLMDCEYYKRCYDKFGLPKILEKITVVNRMGKHQITNSRLTDEIRQKELNYVTKKIYDKTF